MQQYRTNIKVQRVEGRKNRGKTEEEAIKRRTEEGKEKGYLLILSTTLFSSLGQKDTLTIICTFLRE
jgi:hypothetical protein